MYVILTAQQTNSLSGGLITILLAIAAAIPLLLRLYFRDRKHSQKLEHKRLMSETQLKEAEMRQRMRIEKAESAQRIKLEKERLRIEQEALKRATSNVDKAAAQDRVINASNHLKIAQKDATMQSMSEKIQQIADLDLFKEKAKRLGCTEDMALGEMALRILSLAPEVSLRELPEGLSDEEKAVALLAAYRKEETNVAVEKEDSAPINDGSGVHESDGV